MNSQFPTRVLMDSIRRENRTQVLPIYNKTKPNGANMDIGWS